MNWDLILAVLFFGLVLLFYYKTKDKWEVHGKFLFMRKTGLGLKLMDKIAKFAPSFIKYAGYSGVFVAFAGMFFIAIFLFRATFNLIFVEGALPQIAPVLPGINLPGIGAIGFWHWIIVLFIVAVVHEFSHGILARIHKIKVKSSGFAFLGPIPLAFVEPDEKQVGKANKKAQLSMFAAGPYSNLISGLIFFLILIYIFIPAEMNFFSVDKIRVNTFTPGLPAETSGLQVPFEIYFINGKKIEGLGFEELNNLFLRIKPEEVVSLETDQGNFKIKTVSDESDSRGLIGIQTEVIKKIKEDVSSLYANIYSWFRALVMWLALISIGVGLFNLLPLGPIDGGRMLFTSLLAITKDEEKSRKIWLVIGYIFLFLILVNFLPWIFKLFNFLIGLFI